MKRFYPLVSLIALTCFAASVSTSAAQEATKPNAPSKAKAPATKAAVKVAPADEYFGRLKLSILGIANTIKDDGFKYDAHPDTFPQIANAIKFTEDAIRDWEQKYPNDPWVAKSLFSLERFYQKVSTDEGRARAKATMVWLVHDFPNSPQGRTGKQELAEGKVGAPPATTTTAVDAQQPSDITKPILGADQKQ